MSERTRELLPWSISDSGFLVLPAVCVRSGNGTILLHSPNKTSANNRRLCLCDMSSCELSYDLCDFVCLGIESEVASIENMYLCIWHILAIAPGLTRIK